MATMDPPTGGLLRYRVVGGDGSARTRWHRVAVAAWVQGGGGPTTRYGERHEVVLRPDSEATPRIPNTAGNRLAPNSLAWLESVDGRHRVRFALRLEERERVVGFGERYDRLDQRGNRLDVRVYEPYKRQWEDTRTYLPMPFFLTSGGWGGWIATSRRVWCDVGATEPDRLWVEAAIDPADPCLRLVLCEGTPQQILAAFLKESGPAVAPPSWVYRPWMSANEWNTQRRLLAEVNRSRDLDIPVGVVVVEAWSDEATFAAFRDADYQPHPDGSPHRLFDFSFPADAAWPDPKGMVDELHRHDIRVLLWQVPLLPRRTEPVGQARLDREVALARDYVVRHEDGRPFLNRGDWFPRALVVDFSNPEARRWWLEKRRYLIEDVGVDGFKTDGGEHPWGDDLRYADGRRGDEANNEYPVSYQAAYHELLDDTRSDGITFSRSGFVGSARYPLTWAGDEDSTWEAYRAAIIAGQQAGVSGIFFWGWDLAGFSGEVPDAELYLRSAAMAAFCPVMQYHSEYHHHRPPNRDRTPWNVAERTGDARVIPTFRAYARLRDRLAPHLDREGRHAVEVALPLMRPLGFDDPDDDEAWRHPLQYRLGRHLVVAPVTEPGATSARVYLPAGAWVDLWTGEAVAGSGIVEREAPLTSIPVFVDAGAAAPLRRELGLADGNWSPASRTLP
jgi:alpha-glucosidase (family GH31 glycosyl hydrolase)